MSQLGSEISGRPEHWAGVTVPYTGILTHNSWDTCNKFSLCGPKPPALGRCGATGFTTELQTALDWEGS